MPSLRVGDRFDSFSDFAEELKNLENTEKVQFYRASSKKLEKVWQNGVYSNKVEEGYIKELVFFEAYYKCKTTNRKNNRTTCKAQVVLGVHNKKQLIIRKLDLEHNHQLAGSDAGNDSEVYASQVKDVTPERGENQEQETSRQGSRPEKVARHEKTSEQASFIGSGNRILEDILNELENHLALTPPEHLQRKLDAIAKISRKWSAEGKKSFETKNLTIVGNVSAPVVEALVFQSEEEIPIIEVALANEDRRRSLNSSLGNLILSEAELENFFDAISGETSIANSEVLMASNADENGNAKVQHLPVHPKPQIISDVRLDKGENISLLEGHRVLIQEEERNVVRKMAKRSATPERVSVVNAIEDAAYERSGYDFNEITMPRRVASRGRPRGSKTVTAIGLRRSKKYCRRDSETSTDRYDSANSKSPLITGKESEDERQNADVRRSRRRNSTPVKFEDMPVLCQVKKMFQWLNIPDKTSSEILKGTRRIKKTDLRLNPLTLRDSFAVNEVNVGSLRFYFDPGTFDDFKRIVEAKRKMDHWTCSSCSKKCLTPYLQCTGCLLRWHPDCTSASFIKGIWFCESCEEKTAVDVYSLAD